MRGHTPPRNDAAAHNLSPETAPPAETTLRIAAFQADVISYLPLVARIVLTAASLLLGGGGVCGSFC